MSDTVAPDARFRVGHAEHPQQLTGCTVILCPEGTVAGVDVRGPAPGSRETALLAADKPIARLDALLFTGGSAFGLAAADGVMRYLAERGVGHPTRVKPIPLVAASVIYDLLLSEGSAYPGRGAGVRGMQRGAAAAGPAVRPGQRRRRSGCQRRQVGRNCRHDEGRCRLRRAGRSRRAGRGSGGGERGRRRARRERPGCWQVARAADGGWLARHVPERWLPRESPVVGTNTTPGGGAHRRRHEQTGGWATGTACPRRHRPIGTCRRTPPTTETPAMPWPPEPARRRSSWQRGARWNASARRSATRSSTRLPWRE